MLFGLFEQNKRRHYRVKLEKDPSFAIALHREHPFKPLPGLPLNISVGGAAAAFPADTASLLEVDSVVTMLLTFSNSEEIVKARARVLECRPEDATCICRFEFVEVAGLEKFLEPSHHAYLNQRHTYRVNFDQETPIPVAIGMGKDAVSGYILDLSISGMGMVVGQEIAEPLEGLSTLRLSFALPDCAEKLILRGEIVFRRPYESDVLIGVRFEEDSMPAFSKAEKAISGLIVAQQQRLLKKRAHLKY